MARVHAYQYHETLFSRVYPGKQDSGASYIPILTELERCLPFSPRQRRRIILRSDAGFGGDEKVNRALEAQWQVLTKGKGGRRPTFYAKRIQEEAWLPAGYHRWMAPAVDPVVYLAPTRHLVLSWITESGQTKYATLVSSVTEWSDNQILEHYDDRGRCETEIQADKAGLKMEKRRKHRLCAQETLILLTDLAHNLLAWTSRWMFPPGTPLAGFGPTRLIEDVLTIPGRLIFQDSRLVEIHLNEHHPYADFAASGLLRLLEHFNLDAHPSSS